MTKGFLWVPTNLTLSSDDAHKEDNEDYFEGFAIHSYGPARNRIKYDMYVGPYYGDPSTLFRWKTRCSQVDVYVEINSIGYSENWLFKKAICGAFDQASGFITLVCSSCNVQRIQALPNSIHCHMALQERDIYIGRARGDMYNRNSMANGDTPTYGALAQKFSRGGQIDSAPLYTQHLMPGLRSISFDQFDYESQAMGYTLHYNDGSSQHYYG